MRKRTSFKKSEVISASEIGEYQYCSYAWWLQRCGYKPESPLLESGKNAHTTLGNVIDTFEIKLKYSRLLFRLGSVLLCIAFLLVFLEVIL